MYDCVIIGAGHNGLVCAHQLARQGWKVLVLERRDLRFRGPKRQGRSQRRPWPDWVDEEPNRIWIYDTTHFPRAGMAVLIIEDLVSRKWITEVVSVEETSTQVQVAFEDALLREGINDLIEARHDNGTAAHNARRNRQRGHR